MCKETLKQVSIKVMENCANEYLKTWSAYGPYTLVEKSEEHIIYKNNVATPVSFARPHIEDWSILEGPGKALAALVEDPGMHNSAMWVYGSKLLAQLVNYKLSDCCGNPTSIGKEVCKFLFE